MPILLLLWVLIVICFLRILSRVLEGAPLCFSFLWRSIATIGVRSVRIGGILCGGYIPYVLPQVPLPWPHGTTPTFLVL